MIAGVAVAVLIGFWPVKANVVGDASYSCGSGFIHSQHTWVVDSRALVNERVGGALDPGPWAHPERSAPTRSSTTATSRSGSAASCWCSASSPSHSRRNRRTAAARRSSRRSASAAVDADYDAAALNAARPACSSCSVGQPNPRRKWRSSTSNQWPGPTYVPCCESSVVVEALGVHTHARA